MRGLTHRWEMRAGAGSASESAEALPLVDRLLGARGIVGREAVERFASPTLLGLHSPRLLPNIDRAAQRLVDAVRGGERIVIFGDYDVDGIAATAILFHTFKAIDPDARIGSYVPHRLEEGYGISTEAIRHLHTEGADVVVSVDCGITAVEPARAARALGLDLIITDHHHLRRDEPIIPDAFAVVHPRLPGSEYPFADLCGAGVAFKLAWHFATTWAGSERVGDGLRHTLVQLLPFVALGTIADVVPLIDENRIMASFGLRLIRHTTNVGLRALLEETDLAHDHIDGEKVGFILAPHLNACGRMGHAAEAIRLLTEADPREAKSIAQQLGRQNRERRRVERSIVEHAITRAEDAGMTGDDSRIIVLADESWHAGVIGIVCSRLVGRFHRPAALMQRQGDVCRGSARSIEGYSIVRALEHCADLLLTSGGHDMAAGFSLEASNLDEFVRRLTEHANHHIAVERLVPTLTIDCPARLDEMTLPVVRRIARCSPFGPGNPRPLVHLSGARINSPPRQVGSHGKHLAMGIEQLTNETRTRVRTIWWNGGCHTGALARGMRIDLAVQPKINCWNGQENVEAVVRDVRILADSGGSTH